MLSLFGEKKYTLIEAVEKQDFNLIKKLIENGADINEQNKDGNNTLMIAVMTDKNTDNQQVDIYKQHEIIKYLLEKGADAFHKNKYNYNVFDIMKHKSHYAEIQRIVEEYHHKSIQQNKNQDTTEDYQLSINSLKEAISSQAIEIKVLQDKLIRQEQNTKKSIDDLILKIDILEEKTARNTKNKSLESFSNKIERNKEKNLKEYSSNEDDFISVKRLESTEHIERSILETIDRGYIGMMGGWISSIAFGRLLVEQQNDKAVPENKRKDLLKRLGYIPHPNLNEGRVNSGISIDGWKKPRLYVKADSELRLIVGSAEIAQSYITAQSNNRIDQLQEVQDATKQHLSTETPSLNQQTEINLANNKLSVESLENIVEMENRQPSKPTLLIQPIIERSLAKNDGIIVKRDSLDDF